MQPLLQCEPATKDHTQISKFLGWSQMMQKWVRTCPLLYERDREHLRYTTEEIQLVLLVIITDDAVLSTHLSTIYCI